MEGATIKAKNLYVPEPLGNLNFVDTPGAGYVNLYYSFVTPDHRIYFKKSDASYYYINATAVSTIKAKEDIHNLDFDIEKFLKLNPISYKNIGTSVTQYGFIAEEVAELYPELVVWDKDYEYVNGGRTNKILSEKIVPETVNYDRITAITTMAIKHIYSETDLLKQKVSNLEKELDLMRKKLDQSGNK